MAVEERKLGLMIWIEDRPVTGNVCNLLAVKKPRKDVSEYSVGDRVECKCQGFGVQPAIIGKIEGNSQRKAMEGIINDSPRFIQLCKDLGIDLSPGPVSDNADEDKVVIDVDVAGEGENGDAAFMALVGVEAAGDDVTSTRVDVEKEGRVKRKMKKVLDDIWVTPTKRPEEKMKRKREKKVLPTIDTDVEDEGASSSDLEIVPPKKKAKNKTKAKAPLILEDETVIARKEVAMKKKEREKARAKENAEATTLLLTSQPADSVLLNDQPADSVTLKELLNKVNETLDEVKSLKGSVLSLQNEVGHLRSCKSCARSLYKGLRSPCTPETKTPRAEATAKTSTTADTLIPAMTDVVPFPVTPATKSSNTTLAFTAAGSTTAAANAAVSTATAAPCTAATSTPANLEMNPTMSGQTSPDHSLPEVEMGVDDVEEEKENDGDLAYLGDSKFGIKVNKERLRNCEATTRTVDKLALYLIELLVTKEECQHLSMTGANKKKKPLDPNKRKALRLTCFIKKAADYNLNGADETFLNKVRDILRKWDIDLKVQTEPSPDPQIVLVLCGVVSRLGTDVDHALQGVQRGKNIIVLLFHHKAPHVSLEVHSDRLLSGPGYSDLGGMVDLVFWKEHGVYDCQVNGDAHRKFIEIFWRIVPRPVVSMTHSPTPPQSPLNDNRTTYPVYHPSRGSGLFNDGLTTIEDPGRYNMTWS